MYLLYHQEVVVKQGLVLRSFGHERCLSVKTMMVVREKPLIEIMPANLIPSSPYQLNLTSESCEGSSRHDLGATNEPTEPDIGRTTFQHCVDTGLLRHTRSAAHTFPNFDAKEMEIGETIETRKFRHLIRCNRMVANAFLLQLCAPCSRSGCCYSGLKTC